MIGAGAGGRVLRQEGAGGQVAGAVRPGQHPAGEAVGDGLQVVRQVELLIFQALVDLGHDLVPQNRRGILQAAGQSFLPVIARPDRCGVVGRVAHEPQVLAGGGGAGLTGDLLAGEVGLLTGTVGDHALEHLGHIIDGTLGQDVRFILRLIAQHGLAVAVRDHGVGLGGLIGPLVGEDGIGRRHIQGGHAFRQTAQSQLGAADVAVLLVAAGQAADELDVELILHKVKARLRGDHIQDLYGHGVEGLLHGIGDRNVAAVAAGGVHGPVSAVDLVHGAVLHRGGGLDLAQLDGRGIDGEGLDGRAWGPLTAGGPVQAAADGLFAQAAGHGYHFPAHVIHNGNGGLQALAAAGDHVLILGVLVDLVHRRLDVRVHAGVDLQAAGEDLGLGVLLGPVVLVAQVLDDVVDDLVHIPGIDGVLFLGAVGLAVAVLVLIGVAEDQFFSGCLVVFLLGDVPLLQHHVKNFHLTLFVEVLRGLDLAGVRVRDGQVAQGVILRGVVRDADEAGTFGQIQLRNVLAEVGVGGGVHAVAPLAQVDIVEVGL